MIDLMALSGGIAGMAISRSGRSGVPGQFITDVAQSVEQEPFWTGTLLVVCRYHRKNPVGEMVTPPSSVHVQVVASSSWFT